MTFQEIIDFELFSFSKYSLSVYRLFLVLILFFSSYLILSLLKTFFIKAGKKASGSEKRFMSLFILVKYFVWVIVIISILKVLGVNLTLLIAGSAALMVGIGFGLKQLFEDYISGIVILIDGTVKINDVIEVDTIVGKVVDIKLRYSRIITRDDIILIIPNHLLISGKVINWSYNMASTRFHVEVGTEYTSDPKKVRTILIQCAKSISKIHNDPPFQPFVRFNNFGDSALEFQLFFWTDETFRVESIKSDLRFAIFSALSAEGITIAYPQRDIHIKTMPENFKPLK